MIGKDGTMWDAKGLYPILKREETIDDYLSVIKRNLLSKEDIIDDLQERLKIAKDEAYASNEMKRMKDELESMRKNYYRGFPISEEEDKKIAEWQKNHDATIHSNPNQYHGCSGGGYIFEFYPTAIGTCGVCVCCSCRNMAHKAAATADTPEAKKNGYDREVYKTYMEEHDGECEFQELG